MTGSDLATLITACIGTGMLIGAAISGASFEMYQYRQTRRYRTRRVPAPRTGTTIIRSGDTRLMPRIPDRCTTPCSEGHTYRDGCQLVTAVKTDSGGYW